MAQLRITPRAREDLLEIWSYIADDSEANADGFIDKIYDTMELLAGQTGLGRHRDELARGIQSFPVGRYVIFYRVLTGAMEVVRVLHGARDIGQAEGDRRNVPRTIRHHTVSPNSACPGNRLNPPHFPVSHSNDKIIVLLP